MARTVNQIYDEILQNKLTRRELDDLDSTSQTAIWKLFAYIVALSIHLHERIFDTHKDEINQLILSSRVHSGKWYQQIALAFQYSVDSPQNLIVTDTFVPRYEVIDDTKKIITRATVRESPRRLYIKVNKGIVPNLQVLTPQEIAAFTSYIQSMRDAGTQIVVQSFPAEKLIFKAQVDYTPKMGQITKEQVFDIVDNYLKNLNWDGVIHVQDIEAALLKDVRVVDIKLIYMLATQYNDLPIFEIYNLPQGINNKSYATVAGHIVLNRLKSEITLNAV